MSLTLLKGLAGVFAIGGLSVGGFFVYQSFKPQNIRDVLVGKGLTLVNADSVGSWKVIAMTNKDNDAFFSFLGISETSDRKVAGSKLKEKCGKALDSSIKHEDYDRLVSEAELWCLQPTPKTLEERLLIDGLETDLSEEDFKSVFKILEKDSVFSADIELTKGSEIEGGKKVRNWCLVELKKPAHSSKDAAKTRCTTPPKNLREVLKSDGLGLISSSSAWIGRYKSLKEGNSDSDLSKDIPPQGSPSISTDEAGGTALSSWCNTEVNKVIHSLSVSYGDSLDKVKKRCV